MKHTVMFRLKGTDAERKELAAKFAEALMKLPEIIPGLKSMETGLNVNPARLLTLFLQPRQTRWRISPLTAPIPPTWRVWT